MEQFIKDAIDGAIGSCPWLRHDEQITALLFRLFQHFREHGTQYVDPSDLAGSVVGAFTAPAWYLDSSNKRHIRDGQNQARELLSMAAAELRSAAARIHDATIASGFIPEACLSMNSLLPERMTSDLSTAECFRLLPTRETLFRLADAIASNDFFDESCSPGFTSQKATWRDWLREARSNIDHLAQRQGVGGILLREVDWVVLAKAAAHPLPVSRDSVRDVLRELS